MNERGQATVSGGLAGLAPVPRLVTFGTFDGVHRGHQRLLADARARANAEGLRSLVVTLEPIPAMVLRPDRFPGRISPVADKLARLAASGVDDVAVLAFSREFAQQSPEAFMAILADATRLRELWVGEGFALGRNRSGDVPRLRQIGEELGFAVVAVPRLADGGEVISSSAVRTAVAAGDVATAGRLLGHPYRISGEVIHGAHLGRTIGYPTANGQPPPEQILPPDGIYVTLARLPGERAPRPAMTYVGTRPAINTGVRQIETHLLDFDGDLYGQTLAVDFLERLRGDATFDGVPALVAQMHRDEAAARAYLARR